MKPPQANASVNSREMEEAMRKVKEAHSLIAAAVEPGELDARVARSQIGHVGKYVYSLASL